MLKLAGLLGGSADAPEFDAHVRVRFSSGLGRHIRTERYAYVVERFCEVDGERWALLRRHIPRDIPAILEDPLRSGLFATSTALDALWRFAGTDGTDEDVRRAVGALGGIGICPCGRAASDTSSEHSAERARAYPARPVYPFPRVGSRPVVGAGRCVPRVGVGSSAVCVAHLMAWARSARLVVAVAAHIKLARKRRRDFEDRIPCLGEQWAVSDAFRAAVPPGQAVAGFERSDGAPVYIAQNDVEGLTAQDFEPVQLPQTPDTVGDMMFQSWNLADVVNRWLAACPPRLEVAVPQQAPTTKSLRANATPTEKRRAIAQRLALNLQWTTGQTALGAVALELASLLEDSAGATACPYCGDDIVRTGRVTRTRAAFPHCTKLDCSRQANTDRRAQDRANSNARTDAPKRGRASP
jgi:hypothetical protein